MGVVEKSPPKNGRYLTNFEQIYRYLINEKFDRTLCNKIVRCISQEAKQVQQFSTQLKKQQQQQQNITLCHYKANKLTQPLLP